MTTPEAQRDSIEAGDNRPALSRLSDIGWFKAAMLATAAIGFLIVLGGAYLTTDPNAAIILAGTIIVILAAIAWIVAGLFVISSIIVGWFTSRGKATPEARTIKEL